MPSTLQQYLNHPERLALTARLLPLMADPIQSKLTDAEFNDLALGVFRFQFERCEPFRRLCLSRGISPAATDHRTIPFVPTDAFKHYRMACFAPFHGEIEFRTSGTTQGNRGIHVLPTTELYDAAAWRWFQIHCVPEVSQQGNITPPFKCISLTGSPIAMPHSSLVHMIAMVGAQLGLEVEFYYGNPGGLEFEPLVESLRMAEEAKQPVLMFTTAFALAEFLERLDAQGRTLVMSPESRIMETGGYKGRRRLLKKDSLYEWTSRQLGISLTHIINEYGMTEMSSQFYDPVLRGDNNTDVFSRVKFPAPWVKSFVINPITQKPVEEGQSGILQHVDLANLDSCAFLGTADAAIRRGEGFELLGRLAGTSARGCSLDYEYAPKVSA